MCTDRQKRTASLQQWLKSEKHTANKCSFCNAGGHATDEKFLLTNKALDAMIKPLDLERISFKILMLIWNLEFFTSCHSKIGGNIVQGLQQDFSFTEYDLLRWSVSRAYGHLRLSIISTSSTFIRVL